MEMAAAGYGVSLENVRFSAATIALEDSARTSFEELSWLLAA